MRTIFIIEKVNFDSDENYNPIHIEIVGYVNSEAEAKNVIKALDNTTSKHIGWNDELYPQFRYKRIKELQVVIGVTTL